MSEDFDWSWVIEGEDYPMMTEKYERWTVRELHLNEASEIVKKTLEYCLLDPPPTQENIAEIPIGDRFRLFIKIIRLTQKSKCFPMYKSLLNLDQNNSEE